MFQVSVTKGQCIYPFCFQILKMNIFYLNCLCFSSLRIFCLQLFFLVLGSGKWRDERTQVKIRRSFTNVWIYSRWTPDSETRLRWSSTPKGVTLKLLFSLVVQISHIQNPTVNFLLMNMSKCTLNFCCIGKTWWRGSGYEGKAPLGRKTEKAIGEWAFQTKEESKGKWKCGWGELQWACLTFFICIVIVLLSPFHSTGKKIYEGRSFKRIIRIWSSYRFTEITRVKKITIWSESYHGEALWRRYKFFLMDWALFSLDIVLFRFIVGESNWHLLYFDFSRNSKDITTH